METPQFKNVYNKPGIELLPHRSPFLFVDTLIAADETGAVGEYTYTAEKNDFFRGHFPGNPIVPGVVLVESMAQVAGAGSVARGALAATPGKEAVFILASVESARFRRPVRPGSPGRPGSQTGGDRQDRAGADPACARSAPCLG